jgi:hypothetical protein
VGVVGRLNALDERAGVRGPLGARRWEARLRLWWLAAASALGVVLVVLGLEAMEEFDGSAAVGIAVLPAAFYSGFLYNERLRALGSRPRLLEVPAEWPASPPAAAGEPAPRLDVPA